MDWLNIHIPTVLRSPEYVGSSPAERGTWLCVLSYACSIECGGVLVGAAGWKDRQWQQSCGVTLREVMASKRLLRVVGDNVEVNGYPKESEEKVRKNRKNGVAGAMARWAKAMDDAIPHCMPHAIPHGMPCANGKGEGEGKGEREGESKYTPISPTESPSSNCASDDGSPWPGSEDETPTDHDPVPPEWIDQGQPETPAPDPAPARKQKTTEQIQAEKDRDAKFEKWFDKYGKKVGKKLAKARWDKLKPADYDKCLEVVQKYVQSKPEVQYRKDPATYLNQECWNDEIIIDDSVCPFPEGSNEFWAWHADKVAKQQAALYGNGT